MTSEEIDPVISANSLSEQLRNGKKEVEDVNYDDEDSLFCRSLIPRMKRLPCSRKYMVRLQIEQLLYQTEFTGPNNGSTGSMIEENQQTGYTSSYSVGSDNNSTYYSF